MNNEAHQMLEEFQQRLRDMADKEKISYTNDGVYGMALMLDSILNDDLTPQEALNEFLTNSDLEIEVDINETKVV